MKTFLIFVVAFILSLGLFSLTALPQGQNGASNAIGVNSNITQIGGASVNTDPCGSWGVVKQSKAINLSSATTTQIVAISGSTSIFVCGFSVTMVGATESLAWEYGTGSSCGTGTTVLTGAFADGTVSDIVISYGGGEMTVFATPSAQALCALTTGTVSIQGVLTYVQQ